MPAQPVPTMLRRVAPEKAKIKLEEMCARAEHCTHELRQKLWQWGVGQEDADAIIDSLVSRRFVNDARFAKVFVRDKYRFNRWGRMKIRMEMRLKRIPDQIINDALEEIDEDIYLEGLEQFLRSRLRAVAKEEDRRVAYQKLMRSAASRGFEMDFSAKIIKKLFAEQENQQP